MAASPDRLVSHSQNREDLYLWALVGHRPNGVYVDVGCNSESRDSVTRLFYDHGWSGVNIDANDRFAPEYSRRERDRFVHAGVGAAPGTFTFRDYVSDHGRSTFSEELKQAYAATGMEFVEWEVPVRTLDEILAEVSIDHVDFLKIDAEGMEPEVLRGLDLRKVRPAVFVVENGRVPECLEILGEDYRVEFFDGLNTYFVDVAASDVTIYNFATSVLVGGYCTAREAALEAEVESLQERVGSLQERADGLEASLAAAVSRSARSEPDGRLRALSRWLRR